MKLGIAAIAAVLAVSPALVTPAVATSTGSNPFSADSAVLDLRGLDLATVDGQQRLSIRMDQAATAVCGSEALSTVHLALGEQARACRADVIADIRSRITAATASADSAKATRLARR